MRIICAGLVGPSCESVVATTALNTRARVNEYYKLDTYLNHYHRADFIHSLRCAVSMRFLSDNLLYAKTGFLPKGTKACGKIKQNLVSHGTVRKTKSPRLAEKLARLEHEKENPSRFQSDLFNIWSLSG
ncbi:hypothetical protein RRG08_054646 [Elysia crispata]|uniref:Uncharacterized protein n=1 Tax=Elysia crispata TaxID=231223 RepID=A0AAE1B1Q6_9GAST|nr:hypothetical protein RRG08_054646 [Elysia crispata]